MRNNSITTNETMSISWVRILFQTNNRKKLKSKENLFLGLNIIRMRLTNKTMNNRKFRRRSKDRSNRKKTCNIWSTMILPSPALRTLLLMQMSQVSLNYWTRNNKSWSSAILFSNKAKSLLLTGINQMPKPVRLFYHWLFRANRCQALKYSSWPFNHWISRMI